MKPESKHFAAVMRPKLKDALEKAKEAFLSGKFDKRIERATKEYNEGRALDSIY